MRGESVPPGPAHRTEDMDAHLVVDDVLPRVLYRQ
jgi:hypothetical protein